MEFDVIESPKVLKNLKKKITLEIAEDSDRNKGKLIIETP